MNAPAQVGANSVDQAVRRVFAQILQVDAESLESETHLVNDLAVDSLDALELALKIQESLRIQLDEEAFAKFTTYGEVVTCAQQLVTQEIAES